MKLLVKSKCVYDFLKNILTLCLVFTVMMMMMMMITEKAYCEGKTNENGEISGRILLQKKQSNVMEKFMGFDSNVAVLHLYQLNTSYHEPHHPILLTKEKIYSTAPFRKIQVKFNEEEWIVERKIGSTQISLRYMVADFNFKELPLDQYYSVFSFMDLNGDSKLDLTLFQPLGWFSDQVGSKKIESIHLNQNDPIFNGCDFELRKTTPFNVDKEIANGVDGKLLKVANTTLLQFTTDDPYKRGYAHGYLTAIQIIDFFRFYILESLCSSAKLYETKIVPILQNGFRLDENFMSEAKGIMDGMLHSASPDDLFLTELNRMFNLTDIIAINAYIEISYMVENFFSDMTHIEATDEELPACSQYALFNSQTAKDPTLNGQLISGRNMDGELDIRKMTNSHLLIFSVLEKHPQRSFISVMWPGFIGTLTSINEDGFYAMMNTGYRHPNPVIEDAVPISVVLRKVISSISLEKATPENVKAVIDSQKSNSTGGSCTTGAVFFFAAPRSANRSSPSAFVYEGDFMGGQMRLPGETGDILPQQDIIMATNHFHIYGVDPDVGPSKNFGTPVYFNTLSRYYMTSHRLMSWNQKKNMIPSNTLSVVQDLLQIVCTGTTEHSIIYKPSSNIQGIQDITFYLSVSDMESHPWYAPYQVYSKFNLKELFSDNLVD